MEGEDCWDQWSSCPECGHSERLVPGSLEAVLTRLLRQRPRCPEWVADRDGWAQPCGCEDDYHGG